MSRPALFVFAKAPVAGTVKTRLQPTYTVAQAAEIAAVLIRETVALAVAHWDGPVYVSTTPDTTHPLFAELASRYAVVLRAQQGSDLGARMHEAIAYGIAQHGAAAVLGCDVPQCSGTTLRDACERLARGGALLGPSADGGYYLIGLAQARPELFTDVTWGGADVRTITVARAHAVGIEFEMLPLLRDIDTPADLAAAAQTYAPLKRFAL